MAVRVEIDYWSAALTQEEILRIAAGAEPLTVRPDRHIGKWVLDGEW